MSTISRIFNRRANLTPAKSAICCEGRALDYGELATLVRRWACGMSQRGVRRGDHIAVLLPNNIEFIALMLAAADLGAVLVPLSTSLPAGAVRRAFDASDVRHVVGNAATLEPLLASDLFAEYSGGLWLSLDELDFFGVRLDELVATTPPDAGPLDQGEGDDPFILTMTSGSTGDPKPIILTQCTKINRVHAAQALYAISADDRILAATPLYHSLAERLVLIPLLTGGTSVLMSRFSASEWLSVVAEQRVSFTIAVSSQLRLIVERLISENRPAPRSLRCIVSSSALLEASVKSDLLARFNCDFHECYGTSEIAIASNLDGEGARRKLNSVGGAAPGVKLAILTKEGGTAAVGEVGEIACQTPMIFGGYFKRPDLTAAAMWGGYFRTGDLGCIDADGFLYFMGRMKEIIISGGINVYPGDIEAVVAAFPGVAECAAFPVADERLGEVVGVALVSREGDEFDLRGLRRHCAQLLADFQQPRKFCVIDKLPRNAMGKIMKAPLIQEYGKL